MERNENEDIRTKGLGGDERQNKKTENRNHKAEDTKTRSSFHLRGFFINYSNLLKVGESSDFQLSIHDIRCL